MDEMEINQARCTTRRLVARRNGRTCISRCLDKRQKSYHLSSYPFVLKWVFGVSQILVSNVLTWA